jgi:hypothetical protein
MICPLMSRPVIYSTSDGFDRSKSEMFEQPCIKEDCPLWVVSNPDKDAGCGLQFFAFNELRKYHA